MNCDVKGQCVAWRGVMLYKESVREGVWNFSIW